MTLSLNPADRSDLQLVDPESAKEFGRFQRESRERRAKAGSYSARSLIVRVIAKFADWVNPMVARFGPAVRKNAARLFFEAKRLAADESGRLTLNLKVASDAGTAVLGSMGGQIR